MQSKLPDLEDAIVALSSAAGPGARAVVRLSGRRAFSVVAALCPDFDANQVRPGHFSRGRLRLPGFHASIPCDLYCFVAPRSYTGQDLIEIHVIASRPIVERLIAECMNAAARGAQAGEFTMRAFLAGKLDLTRAEAVLGVIEATQRDELKQALKQLAGGIAQPLAELREDLLNLLADVEAGLDFIEEGIHFASADSLLKRLAKGLAYLTLLRKQFDRRALGQRPFRVVLAGPPNAGKSSLFNALVRQKAALVSAEPGTTRDYLEYLIDMDGSKVQFVDTAGLRESSDAIETAAQTLGKEQSDVADLTLWCSPCDEAIQVEPLELAAECWHIATKSDLGQAPANWLGTSIATGEGLSELRERLAARVRRRAHAALAPSLSRCSHHLETCLQHLRSAHAIVLNEEAQELLALELRLALDEIGAMAGAVYTDDLLDRIFSRFCIGK